MKNSKKALIISGFPGIGKTYFKRNISTISDQLNVIDLDSSNFDLKNHLDLYLDTIESLADRVDILLISSHKVVRDHLVNKQIPFIVSYPKKEMFEDYIKSYKSRNDDDQFITYMEENFISFIDEIEGDKELTTFPIFSSEMSLYSSLEFMWNHKEAHLTLLAEGEYRDIAFTDFQMKMLLMAMKYHF